MMVATWRRPIPQGPIMLAHTRFKPHSTSANSVTYQSSPFTTQSIIHVQIMTHLADNHRRERRKTCTHTPTCTGRLTTPLPLYIQIVPGQFRAESTYNDVSK